MLDDRDYMRAPSRLPWGSWTAILLVVNVAVFIVGGVLSASVRGFSLESYLALSFEGLRHGWLWQPVTYMFLHAGLWHLIGNLIVIFFFGPPIEQELGRSGFLKVYFGSGIGGGLLQVVGALLFPHSLGGAVVGASAGAFGLVAAFATLWPERSLTLLLFFVIPFSLRAKYLLLIEVLLSVLGLVRVFATPAGDGIAHLAHLGGILVGVGVVRWGARLEWPEWLHLSIKPKPRLRVMANASPRPDSWKAPSTLEAELPATEFMQKEVDPILDKISAQGIQSLTNRERRILEAASARFDKR